MTTVIIFFVLKEFYIIERNDVKFNKWL